MVVRIVLGLVLLATPIAAAEPSPSFYLTYHWTSEVAYEDVKIDGYRLEVTWFEDPDNRCGTWIPGGQACWTTDQLTKKTVHLSGHEMSDLKHFIKQTGFLNLRDIYGADESERFYAYRLGVVIDGVGKDVLYRSSPRAERMPGPMEGVMERVRDLARQQL